MYYIYMSLDTPKTVDLLWTRDRPIAENSTWQHSQETDIYKVVQI